jgi:hypothetical protein
MKYIWLTILLALALLPAPPSVLRCWGAGVQGRTLLCSPAPLLPSTNVEAAARQSPTVRIDPASVVVGAGRAFAVSVMIDQAEDLGGFEFTLLFATTAVTVDDVAVGDFLGSTGREVIPVGPTIDNQTGMASFAVATVPPGTPGPSGTGVLATVTLTAQSRGESSLDLQNVVVLDTSADRQTPTIEDGVVRVGFAIYLPLILKDWQE